MKQEFLVRIQGMYNKQYIVVDVYDEDIDYNTLKRKDAGFTINYYNPNPIKSFQITAGDRFDLVIDLPLDSVSHGEQSSVFYFAAAKNASNYFNASTHHNNFWIGIEKVRYNNNISNANIVVNGVTYEGYTFQRGRDYTLPQYYIGRKELNHSGFDKRIEDYTFTISNYLKSYVGLVVWLQNPEGQANRQNSVEYIGVIDSISETKRGLIIECKPISSSLDFNIPEVGLELLKRGEFKYPEYNKNLTMWGIIQDSLGGSSFWSYFNTNHFVYAPFTPYLHKRPAICILAKKNTSGTFIKTSININNIKPLIPDFILNSPIIDNKSEEIQKINVIKLIYILEVLTGYFLFTGVKGRDIPALLVVGGGDLLFFKNIFGKITDFDDVVLDEIEMKGRVTIDKTVSQPFSMLDNIKVTWKDDKHTYFNSATYISLKGRSSISIDLSNIERDEEKEQTLLDGFVDRHLYISSKKICTLKLEIPAYDPYFNIGQAFKMTDIDEFFTWQGLYANKYSNEAITINNEKAGEGKAELELLIGDVAIVKPIAPFLIGIIRNINNGAGTIRVKFNHSNVEVDTLEDVLLFKDAGTKLNNDSPFELAGRTRYFEVGDSIGIYIKTNLGMMRNEVATISIVANTTLTMNVNNTGDYSLNQIVGIAYTGIGTWQEKFITKGVDRWKD